MKSIEHVMWRGALALALTIVGIGSGIGMPPAETGKRAACVEPARVLIVRLLPQALPGHAKATALVIRRGVKPARSAS